MTKYTQNARHNQAGLSESLIAKVLDKPLGSTIVELLGDGPARLVVRQDAVVRLSHPLFAEQTLRILIGGATWKAGLKELALEFLREIYRCLSSNGTAARELFENLFVRRYDLQSEQKDSSRHFSPLVIDLGPPEGSQDGQQEVFVELTKLYPKNGHYWNHRARHLIYIMHQHYDRAIEFLDKAISIEPEEMVHYHTKGLVYRFWINNDMEAMFKHGQEPRPEELLDAIRDRPEEALECFEAAQKRSPASTYPAVTRLTVDHRNR